MRFSRIITLSALLVVTAAAAQSVPSTEQATVPAKPARAKKPSAPPSVVTVANASTQTAVLVLITAEDATASTSKPLRPKERTTLKLPKLQGCTVSVTASFEGGGQVDIGEFDVCKDKTIRFTD
jgi:hypothetical protein